jgi:hypothetical protein
MNSENIKTVANQAIEQLVEALQAGEKGKRPRRIFLRGRFGLKCSY